MGEGGMATTDALIYRSHPKETYVYTKKTHLYGKRDPQTQVGLMYVRVPYTTRHIGGR